MNQAWKVPIVQLCQARWELGPHRIRGLLDELEFLIATDQLSEFSISGALARLGVKEPAASENARTIRAAIGDTRGRAGPAPGPQGTGPR